MTGTNWARLVGVVVVALVFQVAVLDNITVLGAHPDVMVLIAAGAGMAVGPERGAIAGFLAGLAADLVVNLPYGLSPLTFVLVGFGAGLIRETVVARGIDGAQVITCVGAAAAGTILYALLGAIFGQHGLLGVVTAEAVLAVTLGALVLSYPALVSARWAFAGTRRTAGMPIPSGGSAVG